MRGTGFAVLALALLSLSCGDDDDDHAAADAGPGSRVAIVASPSEEAEHPPDCVE